MSAPQCYGPGTNPTTIPGEDLHPDAIVWEVLRDGTQRLTAVLGRDGWVQVTP